MPLAGARAVGERISGEKAFARGERVAFLAPPGVDFVKTLLGVWQVGGVAVPLCVTHPEAELRYAMSEADACVVAAASCRVIKTSMAGRAASNDECCAIGAASRCATSHRATSASRHAVACCVYSEAFHLDA